LAGPWPPLGERGTRRAGVCEVVGPSTVVLGSAQAENDVDRAVAAERDVEVARRSGGGGAVLVAPGAQVWVELWVPRADPLWDDDIVAGAQWVGATWARALASLGARDLEVHGGRATRTAWSDTVCFAGIGPGEVLVAGRKVVGLSQRRTSAGVRIHTVAPLCWDGEAIALLVGDGRATVAHPHRDPAALAAVAVGLDLVLGDVVDTDASIVRAVEAAVVSALP
jgi:lipoate-protein ligase A